LVRVRRDVGDELLRCEGEHSFPDTYDTSVKFNRMQRACRYVQSDVLAIKPDALQVVIRDLGRDLHLTHQTCPLFQYHSIIELPHDVPKDHVHPTITRTPRACGPCAPPLLPPETPVCSGLHPRLRSCFASAPVLSSALEFAFACLAQIPQRLSWSCWVLGT
jgi:hypothetical protein